jgi:cell division protein FtsN
VAETTTSKTETVPRAEAAVRAPTPPAPTPVAPSPHPPTPAPGAPAAPGVVSEGWSVQLGAYASEGSAVSLRDTLARSWPDARILRAEVSGRTVWRVRVGNYASRRDADEAAKRLTASGYRAMVVESGRP